MTTCFIVRTQKNGSIPFGRCLLASDVMKEKPLCFYTLDENDNIKTRFITSLVTAYKWISLQTLVIHTENSQYIISYAENL